MSVDITVNRTDINVDVSASITTQEVEFAVSIPQEDVQIDVQPNVTVVNVRTLNGYVPLQGTEVGHHITGDFSYGMLDGETRKITHLDANEKEQSILSGSINDGELLSGISLLSIDNDGNKSYVGVSNSNSVIQYINADNSKTRTLSVNESGCKINDSDNTSLGLYSDNDFSEVEPTNLNIYAQRQFVVDKIAEINGATFDPSDYDLTQFTNTDADPFVRESDIPSPTLEFVPSEHDLDEFTNTNTDPFAKISDLPSEFTPSSHDLSEFTNTAVDPYAKVSQLGSGSSDEYINIQIYGYAVSTIATANYYIYLNGADTSKLSGNRLDKSSGSGTLGTGIINDINDFFIAPFGCKLKKVKLSIQSADGGVITLGIRKYKRADDSFNYSNALYDGVNLLEQAANSGSSTTLAKQYIEEWSTDIADTVIAENERLSLLFKSSQTVGTRAYPFSINLTFRKE